jgi:hypothetical protein
VDAEQLKATTHASRTLAAVAFCAHEGHCRRAMRNDFLQSECVQKEFL